MWFCKAISVLVVGVVLALGSTAFAVTIPHGTVDLIAETDAVRPGTSFYAGLQFQLEPGWHIYWINPGDAGQPPRVTWHLPVGITAGEIEWPYPQQLAAFSNMDFGYEGKTLLLVPMKADSTLKATTSANLGADLKLIVCREMCIPGKAQLALSLPVKAQAAASSTKPLFDAAIARVPKKAPATWKFSVRDQKEAFNFVASIGRSVSKAVFFPLEESQVENAAPQSLQPRPSGFQMTLKKSNLLVKPIERLRGVLLLGDKAYTIEAPVAKK